MLNSVTSLESYTVYSPVEMSILQLTRNIIIFQRQRDTKSEKWNERKGKKKNKEREWKGLALIRLDHEIYIRDADVTSSRKSEPRVYDYRQAS